MTAGKSRLCARCGNILKQNARFCSSCGGAVAPQEPEHESQFQVIAGGAGQYWRWISSGGGWGIGLGIGLPVIAVLLGIGVLLGGTKETGGGSESGTSSSLPLASSSGQQTSTNLAPSFSQERGRYLAEIDPALDSYEDAIEVLGQLSDEGAADPAKLRDEDWRSHLFVTLLGIQVAGEVIRLTEPPTCYVDLHADLVLGADMMHRATTRYAEGVDLLDGGILNASILDVNEASRLINATVESIRNRSC